MPEIVRALVLLESVKLAELDNPMPTEPKFLLVGLKLTEELPEAPVPVRVAIWGLFGALSLTVSVPVSVPDDTGLKVTVIVQDPFAAKVCGEIGQLDVCE
jgi:hypothetical protein